MSDMRMEDPKPTFSYLLSEFVKRVPELAYVHLVEPGIKGIVSVSCASHEVSACFRETSAAIMTTNLQSNDFIREIWSPRPIISAGAYTRDTAIQRAETKGDLIAFGRPFIGNVRAFGSHLMDSHVNIDLSSSPTFLFVCDTTTHLLKPITVCTTRMKIPRDTSTSRHTHQISETPVL